MAQPKLFLALDLGAESGRSIAGSFDGRRLTLSEVHRFTNRPVQLFDSLYWDVLSLFAEIKTSLALAVQQHGPGLAGLGIDVWGNDFALLDEQGELLGNAHHYRDPRTEGMLEAAFERLPRQEIFNQTGIQFMRFNTLYQLLALVTRKSPQLAAAKTFLMIPDLFNYWLTGQKSVEYTVASTSQCLDPVSRSWNEMLLAKMGIPLHIFPAIIQPGSILGHLLPAIAAEVKAGPIPVIAPGCHDTASAVAAVPAEGNNYAYLSSGTWSLMGVEVSQPVINADTLAYNFTNEGGVANTIRLLKNIGGLWLIQECRRAWAAAGEPLAYEEIARLAAEAPSFVAVIDPDDADFAHPGSMPERIKAYCQRTGQPEPDTIGSIARTIFESLALRYRWVLEKLEAIRGQRLERLHIIGGGSQNKLLNQFTANALNRPVVAGPSEATAIGNILLQMLALGDIASLEQGRELVRFSFETELYLPGETGPWDEAYARFLAL